MPARVLAIDDALALRKVFSRLLHIAGYEVRVAATPAEAFQEIVQFQPHVILLDWFLGTEQDSTQILDELEEQAKGVPIILTSGLSREELTTMAPRAHNYRFLTKPFDFDQLIGAVKEAVGPSHI